MFGKLFKKSPQGPKWYNWLLELFIVFIGVYLAFLLNSYSESQKNQEQQHKVLNSLKFELERLRFYTPGYASYQEEKIEKWHAAIKKDSLIDFYEYLFIQPQYDYTALEYAININETEVVNYELFTALRKVYNHIKSLEFTENKMTDMADRYRNTTSALPKSSLEYKSRRADNRFYFYRFIFYGRARKDYMLRIAQSAVEALTVINEQMNQKEKIKIEGELILSYFQRDYDELPPEAMAAKKIKEFFPDYPEQELKDLMIKLYQK